MPFFKYSAITDSGGSAAGVVEAADRAAAQELIAGRGLIPTRVAETSGPEGASLLARISGTFHRVKTQDVVLFTKQLKTMLNAGIPVLQSLDVLHAQTENARIKAAIVAIGAEIRGGSTLSRAFAKHPAIFSRLYCNMIRAGEISGTLTEVLDRLIYIIEHEDKIRRDIKSALTYPVIVVFALILAFFILILFVFPHFVQLFAKVHAELPLPTRICLGIYTLMTRFWLPTFGGLAAAGFALAAYFRTEGGRIRRDGLILRLPIVGSVFRKAAMARFASIFAILQASGITVLEAMDILAETIGNASIARDFRNLRGKLEAGHGLSGPLRATPSFPPMMVSMIGIGEETGNLEDMLRAAAHHYDDEVAYSVSRMSDLIGPILVAGLACVVGFFALAIFLPMVDVMQAALNNTAH